MFSDKKQAFRLILASGSPRRHELLAKMGYAFEIIIPDVDEDVDGSADSVVTLLSHRKATAVSESIDLGLVIASDTLVSLNGMALGKPADEADAFRMLRELSGRMHEVFTGVTIIDAASGKHETRCVRTGVLFRELSDDEIRAYIATGDPMDKAGAYGIQGDGGKFVEKLEGSFENVMGFPVDDVQDMLNSFINN